MKIAVADIETNGLLDNLTEMYCASVRDLETGFNMRFRDVDALVKYMATFDEVWFHNGISFDYPALCKVHPATALMLPPHKIKDTLVLSRLCFPTLASIDAGKARKHRKHYTLPPKMFGSHSLGAWGYRLGDYKGDFSPADYVNPATGEPHTWESVGYSEDMAVYCDQDTEVTRKLLKLLLSKLMPPMAVDLEHDIQWLMTQQEMNGFVFDEKAAAELYAELASQRAESERELVDIFGTWYAPNGGSKSVVRPKKTLNYKEKTRPDLTEGAPYTKIKRVTFNPGSRDHVARCLKLHYGWEPDEFTDSGKPKIDADVLSKLSIPEATPLKKYFDIVKLLGQLAEGDNAWLKKVRGGKIHGRVNPNGAGTGRATHNSPNVAQVPKGPVGSYGHRCRSLFTVPVGWVLLGSDASGLELRCLANALFEYDAGAYAELVLNGDVHWNNVLALGLFPAGTVRDKHNEAHENARNLAKTWIYAFLYGSGNENLGSIVGWTEEERDVWRAKGAHKKVINYLKRQGEAVTVNRVCNILKGQELRTSFLKAIPAIKEFQEDCKLDHKENGGVLGLDGRFIKTRSAHSATNFRLQGDGALVCKLWGTLIEKRLKEQGLRHGWDGDYAFCAWVHDEYQIACRNEQVAHIVGKACEDMMREVGRIFNFKCRLDAEYDIGKNWSETH